MILITDDVLSLFKLVHKLVDEHGIKKLYSLLSEIKDPVKAELIDFILFKTADAYQVTIEEIKSSKKRGNITISKKTCFILFKNHLNISQAEISRYFKRSGTLVNKALKEFKELNLTVKSDKVFLEKYNVLNEEINSFKEQLIIKYSDKK